MGHVLCLRIQTALGAARMKHVLLSPAEILPF